MTEQVPPEVIARYFSALDDERDRGPSERFRDAYLHESDEEIERKRKILRNRILAVYEPEQSRERIEILSKIVQDRQKERQTAAGNGWRQVWVNGVFTLGGGAIGALLTKWLA